mgnify:FL=1
MKSAKYRIYSLSTKEDDLKMLRDRIDELEIKEKLLEDLEAQMQEIDRAYNVENIIKILKDNETQILKLKHQASS